MSWKSAIEVKNFNLTDKGNYTDLLPSLPFFTNTEKQIQLEQYKNLLKNILKPTEKLLMELNEETREL